MEIYISYDNKTKTIKLFRPKNEKYDTLSIEYIRIESIFQENYPYPNPIYYYTRKKLLSGSYLVKDATGKTISKKLTIQPNGLMNGFSKFDNYTIYYSTDVFCGAPVLHDLVIVEENILNENGKISAYGFNRKESGDIELRENKISEEIEGEVIYRLIRY